MRDDLIQNAPALSGIAASGRLARTLTLFSATLALGLITGFFYAYEVSVMRGFARLTDPDFISAMQAVNATIRNAAFAPSFFGAASLSVLAVLAHGRQIGTKKGLLVLAAAAFYVFGGLVLTMRINVPLNEWLAAQGPAALMVDATAIRVQYEADWVFWNLMRTFASGAAFLMMLGALWLDGQRR